jgi:hypothetical protein
MARFSARPADSSHGTPGTATPMSTAAGEPVTTQGGRADDHGGDQTRLVAALLVAVRRSRATSVAL